MKLFVYGTLRPNKPADDSVRGDMYDLGAFPAVVSVGDSDNLVQGNVVIVNDEQLKALDVYEGVAVGLYRRIRTTTTNGDEVWIYEYGGVLPEGLPLLQEWPSQ